MSSKDKKQRGFKLRQPFGGKSYKPSKQPAVNSTITGTSAVQVKETRKGRISVYVDSAELDENSNPMRTAATTKAPSPQRKKEEKKKKSSSSKKSSRRRTEPADSPDSAFFSGEHADIPPNMVRQQKEIAKTYNYSYSRSGRVKENAGSRTSINALTARFESDLAVKPDSAMEF